ncbi:MAG: hypothetical protein IKN08_02370 [Bacteroidales bacterium]|nr:hypothetical protein [Bacteroidales bacterium]MBR6226961.1 hypothetical protein [Bacteroidales bacterium]
MAKAPKKSSKKEKSKLFKISINYLFDNQSVMFLFKSNQNIENSFD